MTDAAPALKPSRSPHDIPTDAPPEAYGLPLAPLSEVEGPEAVRRSAAEEARTIAAGTNVSTLATLTADGHPWASVITHGVMEDGSPVICVSTLALHGRNLVADQRGSLAIAGPIGEGEDPGDCGRVTFAGRFQEPTGEELAAAREAYRAAVPSSATFDSFGDFTYWVMRPEKVRWVGGFGRMASATPQAYAEAEPDPVAPQAAYAVSHMNEDHPDALLDMARKLAGHTDATSARCLRADRYGLDLEVETPRGRTPARVGFVAPITAPGGLRAAAVELARRARGEG